MTEGRPQRPPRTWQEVMRPEGSSGTWKELPGLLKSSFALVWQAGRRQFVITSTIQLLTAVSMGVQLLLAREVLQSILHAHDFRHVLPWLAAIVGLTIAGRIAIDEHRRHRDDAELPDPGAPDAEPAYAELAELTGELPPKERAAVVLRYGYDLDYAQIAAALGSSSDAARQAASSGVRRLRKKGASR